MDLADLTRDLEALQAEALAAIEAAPDVATLERSSSTSSARRVG